MASQYIALVTRWLAMLAITCAITLVIMIVAVTVAASVNHLSTMDVITGIVRMAGDR